MDVDFFAFIAIVFLSIAVVATLGGYLRLHSRVKKLQEEEEEIHHRARQKAGKVLEHAQEAAFQIANEAVLKAQESQQIIREKLDEVAQRQLQEYQASLKGASTDISKETVKMLELKMDEEWTKLRQELENYKQQKKLEIDRQATEVIKRVSKQVIGRSIDPATHTILLTQALEAAKKEYGF